MNKEKEPKIIQSVVNGMGGRIEEFIPERNSFFIYVKGKKILFEKNLAITRTSFSNTQMTKCKDITNKLLRINKLPCPAYNSFYSKTFDKKTVISDLSHFKYPIILKNAIGSNSRGIFPYVFDVKEALKILEKNLPLYKSMIAQEMVFGKEYRVLVLGDKVIGALEMIHPRIIGDGVSTIREIIKEKRLTTDQKIKFDRALTKILKSQNVSLKTILPKRKVIYIKGHSCLAQGGETNDVTNLIHKDIKKICVKVSKVVGRYLAGVDIICDDISKKPTKKSFNILEINGKPDLFIHYNPTYGKSQNVLKDVINFLLKLDR